MEGTRIRRVAMVLSLVVCLTCSNISLAAAPAVEVVYPPPESPADVRYNDLIEILHGALEHTVSSHGPYRAHAGANVMTEARELATLQDGGELNVVWSSTSEEKERDLLPIRIPLRKGLLGFRIALIAQDEQARIDKVESAEDLRKLVIGQGIGWGDVALYNQNGFTVVTAQYDKLFLMTAGHRFDLFPRGIGEVYKEFAEHTNDEPRLAIEQHLLIQYPWPYYFFFNKKDTALKQRIESGIRAMMKDGSFDAIFHKYNDADIERANLAARRVIRISNPFLPRATPLGDRSLWYDPMKGK